MVRLVFLVSLIHWTDQIDRIDPTDPFLASLPRLAFLWLQHSLSLPSPNDKNTTILQSHLLIFMKENGISVQPHGRMYITGRERERAGTSRTN
jgi:hypothetical protein